MLACMIQVILGKVPVHASRDKGRPSPLGVAWHPAMGAAIAMASTADHIDFTVGALLERKTGRDGVHPSKD